MRIRRTVLVCIVCLFSWGAASGVAVVLRTIGIYSGACEKLSGFPGVLQAAGFVPSGTCRFEPDNDNAQDKKKHCPPRECTFEGEKGKCVEEPSDSGPVCVCRPTKISR
jgi:hypothetical protein